MVGIATDISESTASLQDIPGTMSIKSVFEFPREIYQCRLYVQPLLMNRRDFVAGTAITLSGVVAGCLDGPLDGEPSRPDPGDISIDGRLHNDRADASTFDLTVETEDGYVLSDDTHEVPGGGTERVAAVGVPGATQTFTVAVNEAELSETLTLDVESSEETIDGYVDIRYTTAGEIELAVTSQSEVSESDSVPVLDGYSVSDTVITPDTERYADSDAWGLFLASHGAAAEYFADVDSDGSDEVQAFIEKTQFGDGDRLVYVQTYAPETCYELRLREQPFIETNGLPVVETEVSRTASADEPCADAVTAVELLMRLSFDADGPPADIVTVRVTGPEGNTREGFQVEAKR